MRGKGLFKYHNSLCETNTYIENINNHILTSINVACECSIENDRNIEKLLLKTKILGF